MTDSTQKSQHNFLYPIRQWLEAIEIHNSNLAHFLCKLIPSQCPFERNIIFGTQANPYSSYV